MGIWREVEEGLLQGAASGTGATSSEWITMVPQNVAVWPSNFQSAFPADVRDFGSATLALTRTSEAPTLHQSPPRGVGKNACNPFSRWGLHECPSRRTRAGRWTLAPPYRSVSSFPLGAGSGLPAPRSGSRPVVRPGVRQEGGHSVATGLDVRAPGLREPDLESAGWRPV